MTKSEFSVWAAAIRTYFPRYNMLPNAEAMDLWYQELKDLPFQVASGALRKWVATEKWPPSIAEIRASAGELVNGPVADWGEGWHEVQKAIRRYGWSRERDAMEALSPAARTAAQRIGWMDICMSENAEALRAQFRQVFQVEAQREREDELMAPDLKSLIAGIGMKNIDDSAKPMLADKTSDRRKTP